MTGPVDEGWNKENGPYGDQRSRPAGIEGIDLGELSRDQRNLVLLDGLVTEFLESKFKDSVDVHCLHQIEKPIVAPTGVSDNSVITRTSILKGRHSGTVYAHATSHIVVGNIPASFVGNLRSCRAGIGRLLRRYRVDYTREMLWFGIEPRGQEEEATKHLLGDRFLTRCYRLVSASCPIVTITERFPQE